MPFRFENLEVWQQALEYIDLIYTIASQLPRSEEFNLKSQIVRARNLCSAQYSGRLDRTNQS